MGVLKWLRRERVTITSSRESPERAEVRHSRSDANIGTIRTDEYKRDLAEFQARRTPGSKDHTTPIRKKTTKALAVSCTTCTADPDNTFNYEQRSASKYKKTFKRAKSDTNAGHEGLPNIQFLFQNQVFMPGNCSKAYSRPDQCAPQTEKRRERMRSPSPLKRAEILDEPLFFKDNSLPCDVRNFLGGSSEELDGVAAGDAASSVSSKGDDKLGEVMNELKHFDRWADEQLKIASFCSDDNKSESSVFGLPLVSYSDVDVAGDRGETWSRGQWGAVPVQVKKLTGVTVGHVRNNANQEVNILRKCRHPNIILLMGFYPDVQNNLYLICEKCVDSLYNLLHVQGSILTAQSAVQYACDVANALTYIRMHGFIHTELSSHSVMVTGRDTAKLADLGPCVKLPEEDRREKDYDGYSPQPCYVNIGDYKRPIGVDCEPLISANSSDSYLNSNAVVKPYESYASCERYRWHAPELFDPDDCGLVYPCSKSDVYSLALILWECCNAKIPWKNSTYKQLKQMYHLWKTGMQLPSDGTYPGCLLDLLQHGLRIERGERPELAAFTKHLKIVKHKLSELDYIVVPARLPHKRSGFTSETWSPSSAVSLARTPERLSDSDDNDSKTESNALYESLNNNDLSLTSPLTDRNHPPDEYYTPLTHARAQIKQTAQLHHVNDTNVKFSRAFTPKSYTPLQIKVPDVKLDCIRSLPKDVASEKCYKFDIKNYSLPNTPIARSNKLRKNAWLSGGIVAERRATKDAEVQSAPGTPRPAVAGSVDRSVQTAGSSNNYRDYEDINATHSFTNVRRNSVPVESTPDTDQNHTWSFKSSPETTPKCGDDGDALSKVSVKPLVAMHEKRIYEANKKTGRSMSLPNSVERGQSSAVKPASHCLDTLQKSLPQLTPRRGVSKFFKSSSAGCPLNVTPPTRNGGQSEQFCMARDKIAKSINFATCDNAVLNRNKQQNVSRSTLTEEKLTCQEKVDQSTDTTGIEDFIKELIRNELRQLVQDAPVDSNRNQTSTDEDILEKGINKILKALGENEDLKTTVKSVSTVKINGSNKPLFQINFGRAGDNSLQVLDKCVNVTIGDVCKEKLNQSLDDSTSEEVCSNPLKRCQAFSAIQEARSTEDLYIDDDLSTQMQENFGGKVKLIPLHGSIHEILCEKENECCLIKVKQENGCDSIYFRCDSDTESIDAIDSKEPETVVYKRSISLIEERIQRILPKDQRKLNNRRFTLEPRPKSDGVLARLNEQTRKRSASSPALNSEDVQLNIDRLIYQDSSSDECVCPTDEEFEMLEKRIEEEVMTSSTVKIVGCVDNLSVIEEVESTLECSDTEDALEVKQRKEVRDTIPRDETDNNNIPTIVTNNDVYNAPNGDS